MCLALLASAGVRPEWNSRKPLRPGTGQYRWPVSTWSRDSPMIAHLMRTVRPGRGVAQSSTKPDLMMDTEQHTYNVFYIPEAAGSPEIPAQEEFVVPFGIRSVLGFGGLLPFWRSVCGDPVLQSSTFRAKAAALFRTLSLSVKLAVLPVQQARKDLPPRRRLTRTRPPTTSLASYRSRVAGLEQLLDVQERMVVEQSGLIERANKELARLASTDALTGVANHRVFQERLDAEHKRAVRNRSHPGPADDRHRSLQGVQ